MAVFVVPRNAAGMRIVAATACRRPVAGEIVLDDVQVPARPLLGELDATAAESRIADVLDDACHAAICAEAVGALDKLLAATVEYAEDPQAVRRAHR